MVGLRIVPATVTRVKRAAPAVVELGTYHRFISAAETTTNRTHTARANLTAKRRVRARNRRPLVDGQVRLAERIPARGVRARVGRILARDNGEGSVHVLVADGR